MGKKKKTSDTWGKVSLRIGSSKDATTHKSMISALASCVASPLGYLHYTWVAIVHTNSTVVKLRLGANQKSYATELCSMGKSSTNGPFSIANC